MPCTQVINKCAHSETRIKERKMVAGHVTWQAENGTLVLAKIPAFVSFFLFCIVSL